MEITYPNNKAPFIARGGEMGKLIRAKDWSKTPLGNPETWPQNLRTALSLLLNSKFPMFIFWGPELICFYNDAYLPSLGATGKHPEMLGGRGQEHWSEIWDVIYPLIARVMQGGEATWSEDQLIPIYRNGRLENVYWTFSYSPVFNEKVSVDGVFVACSETTEKVNAYKSLEESNLRYFNNIMQTPVAMCIFRGKNHVVEIANDMMLELWGKTAAEVINKPIFEGLPEAKDQGLEQLLDHVFKTGEQFSARERPVNLPRTGQLETVYVNFIYEALKEPDGNISGIVAAATDVTEQALARKKIEENEAQFRALADNNANLAWMAKADGYIFWYNRRWYDYTGATPGQMEGWGWQSVHDPQQLPGVMKEWQRSIATGRPFEMIFPLKGADGVFRPFLTRITPILDAEGKVIRWFGSNTDISEQKKAEEQFRALAEQAPMWVWTVDKEANIEYANSILLRFIGLTRYSELTGKVWEKVIAEEDVAAVYAAFNEASALKISYKVECRFMNAETGKYEWFQVYGAPRFEQNEFTGFIGTAVNTHLQKIQLEDLQSSERRFQAAVGAVQGVLWTNNAKGEMEGDQPGWAMLTGQRFEEYQGYGWGKAVHPDDVQPTVEAWEEAVRGKKKFIFEHRVRKKNGEWGNFFIQAIPIVDPEGNILEWVGVHTDITAQRQAETSLKNANEQLKIILNNIPAAIYLFDKDQKLIFINQLGAKTYGDVTPEQLLEGGDLASMTADFEDIYERFDEAGARMLPENYPSAKAFQTRAPAQATVKWVNRQTGQTNWYIIHSFPILDAEGNIFQTISTSTDVTAQKFAEEEIRQNEERFRTLAETLPQMIWVTDASGKLEYASPRWKEYSGLDPKGMGTRRAILHPEELENAGLLWKESLETGKFFHSEVRMKSKTGEYRWHSVFSEPVYNSEGKIIKWVGAFTDIHQEKSFSRELEAQIKARTKELADAYQQLVEKNRELERKNKELQSFAYVSSHDLQEPLRKIQTFSDRIRLTESQHLTEKGKDYFQRIQNAAFRMRQLIQDLLDFSRLNEAERVFAETDLREMIEELKAEFQEKLKQKHGTIELTETCRLRVIPFQFNQLLFNLIGNSLKFSRSGVPPAIKISSRPATEPETAGKKLDPLKKYCRITVEDNGIGFESQYSERIFEVFQRLNDRETFEGTGVGLAIVKKIVENHNGAIVAKGEPDKGAAFEIFIPA